MQSGVLNTITKLIQSPPKSLGAGVVLFGAVWGFFKGVESILTDDTKFEMAVWLVGVKVGQKVKPWPDTFAKVFDRVFGTKHLSWKCFWRSCLASYGMVAVVILWESVQPRTYRSSESLLEIASGTAYYSFFGNVVPDFVSLLETRYVLGRMVPERRTWMLIGWVMIDLLITTGMALLVAHVILSSWWVDNNPLKWSWTPKAFWSHFTDYHQVNSAITFTVPAFFTSVWLWLYAGSGFLLKAARRFDIGFDWFNRKFDIEKKPLSSIGFVAAVLVVVCYSSAVIITHIWK